MKRLLAFLLMFAFIAVAMPTAPAQDEKKPDVKKDDETKKDETKKEEPKPAPETKAEAKPAATVPIVVAHESDLQAKAKEVGEWWPLISLVLFGGLFFLVVRLRSDLAALQEQVKG